MEATYIHQERPIRTLNLKLRGNNISQFIDNRPLNPAISAIPLSTQRAKSVNNIKCKQHKSLITSNRNNNTQFIRNKYLIFNNINTLVANHTLGYNAASPANQQWQQGNSTWHHIIPRSELMNYLQYITYLLAKISQSSQINQAPLFLIVTDIIRLGINLGFNINGNPSQKAGSNYYCLSANGFLGPNSANRDDDPHNRREKKPPYLFPRDHWNNIFQWVHRLYCLTNFIANNVNRNMAHDGELLTFLSQTYLLFQASDEIHTKLLATSPYITNSFEWRKTDNNRYTLI